MLNLKPGDCCRIVPPPRWLNNTIPPGYMGKTVVLIRIAANCGLGMGCPHWQVVGEPGYVYTHFCLEKIDPVDLTETFLIRREVDNALYEFQKETGDE